MLGRPVDASRLAPFSDAAVAPRVVVLGDHDAEAFELVRQMVRAVLAPVAVDVAAGFGDLAVHGDCHGVVVRLPPVRPCWR